jgi:TonB family protein
VKREHDSDGSLNLLLEDSGQRPRQRPANLSPQRLSISPLPSEDDPHLHLLIDDYPARTRDWWTAFRPHSGLANGRSLATEARPLRLLLGDYRVSAGRADWPVRSLQRSIAVSDHELELDLEVHWEKDFASARRREARLLSAVAHGLLIVFLMLQPYVEPRRPDIEKALEGREVTLLMPPEDILRELTQKAPNQSPPAARFRGAPELAAPVMRPREEPLIAPPGPPIPAPEPQALEEIAPQPKPEQNAPERPEEQPRTAPAMPAAQSPNPGELQPGRDLARARGPSELPVLRQPPASSKPQLQIEQPATTSPGRHGPLELGSLGLDARPGQIVEGAVRELAKGGSPQQAVGDDFGTGGLGGYLPPSPGNTGSNLELLSDPKGVDFRPYLLQVLSAVRRNWYAVIPESARLGISRGRTTIQFAIVRNGAVSKLVIANSSGAQPLDRAAVAGISASNPFPPLPREYPGADIRLQFQFLYNTKNR